jgi:hypothetical protein
MNEFEVGDNVVHSTLGPGVLLEYITAMVKFDGVTAGQEVSVSFLSPPPRFDVDQVVDLYSTSGDCAPNGYVVRAGPFNDHWVIQGSAGEVLLRHQKYLK